MIATNAAVLTRALNSYRKYLGVSGLRPASVNFRERSASVFTEYLDGWLREHEFELRQNPAIEQLADGSNAHAANLMPIREVVQLLDALAVRGLRWADGELHDAPEPGNGYIVFDADSDVWQRDDASAISVDRRWFMAGDSAPLTWAELRARGRITPPGGIAPTTTGDTP